MLTSVQSFKMSKGIYTLSVLLAVVFCKTVNGDIEDIVKELSLKLSESQVSYSIKATFASVMLLYYL